MLAKTRHAVEREDPLQEVDLAETYVETVVDTVLQQFGRDYFQDPCRGDQDCPTTCPERTASDPLCPAWQQQILIGPVYKDVCPRLPAAQPFDAGDGEDAETAVG